MKLTARTVAALRLPAGKTDVIHFDDTLKRFGYRLRLGAGGKVLRSWIVQYRHAGATRRMRLGPDGPVTAEKARRKAMQALGRVADGTDPQADKQDRRDKDRRTFKSAVADYLAIKKRDVRGRTFTEKSRYLTGPYFKPLHGLALDQITRADVATRLNRITVENSSTVAALARAQLSALFTWALTQGLCESNPVVGTASPKTGKPRERVLSDSELASIWKACGDDDHSKCIRLLILSGCRRQEIGGMAWSEIDVEKGTWTLPAARAKSRDCAREIRSGPRPSGHRQSQCADMESVRAAGGCCRLSGRHPGSPLAGGARPCWAGRWPLVVYKAGSAGGRPLTPADGATARSNDSNWRGRGKASAPTICRANADRLREIAREMCAPITEHDGWFWMNTTDLKARTAS